MTAALLDGPIFRDRTAESGVRFAHVFAPHRRYQLPETVSGGAALFDADGDGDLDLYLVQGGDILDESASASNRLYRNDGEWRFTDVTDHAGVGDRGYGVGVATADIDRDGDLDLFITNVGANVLYRNDGDLRFTDITDEAGVGDRGFGSSCAFADLDGDGAPDLFVTNYIRWRPETELECTNGSGARDYCAPNNYQAAAPDLLYRNRGDGTFENVTAAAGVDAAYGNGLGVVIADLDGDHRLDIAVANDGNPNQLWVNRGEPGRMRFGDLAHRAGAAVDMNGMAEAGMGIVAFDAEGDGDLDLFLTHLRNETNTFYRNDGGTFTDATVLTGLAGASRDRTGWGQVVADFDHDGQLDLFVGNGRVMQGDHTFGDDPYAEPDQFFLGIAPAKFREVPEERMSDAPAGSTRAVAMGDIDDDGDLDLVIVTNGGAARLLENRAGKRGGSVTLTLVDAKHRSLAGTIVRAEVQPEGTPSPTMITRLVGPGGGYASSHDERVHLGLGASKSVTVEITWPDGEKQTAGPYEAGERRRVVRGE